MRDIEQNHKEAMTLIDSLQEALVEKELELKTYKEALQKIAAPQYGLQSIIEDYSIDTPEYYKSSSDYFSSLVRRFQAQARKALSHDK
jgi:hypothetical protein